MGEPEPEITEEERDGMLKGLLGNVNLIQDKLKELNPFADCKDLAAEFQKQWPVFVVKNKLTIGHFIFIVLDRRIFAHYKSHLMQLVQFNSMDTPAAEIEKRDAVLQFMEEFHATEVPFYQQKYPIEENAGKLPQQYINSLVADCEISRKVMQAITDCFLRRDEVLKFSAEVRMVCIAVDREIRRRTMSPAEVVYQFNRQQFRAIREAMYGMERISDNNEFGKAILYILSTAVELITHLRDAHKGMYKYVQYERELFPAENTALAILKTGAVPASHPIPGH